MDNGFKELNLRYKIAALVVGFILLIGIGLYSLGNNKLDIDKYPEEGTSTDYSQLVNIYEDAELYVGLGGTIRHEQVARDLHYFAKNSYEAYRNRNGVIGFLIESEIKKDNTTVSFSGRFGAVSNKIVIEVVMKPNYRNSTSITDKKTGKQIDSRLPSNSKRNQLISKLPIKDKKYLIEYEPSNDMFVINIFDGGSNELSLATKRLSNELGVSNLEKEKYQFIRSGGLGSDRPLVDNGGSRVGE
jgi:hypothetical protein